ncbi:MAG: sugar transferase [Anaerolineales bacterium]
MTETPFAEEDTYPPARASWLLWAAGALAGTLLAMGISFAFGLEPTLRGLSRSRELLSILWVAVSAVVGILSVRSLTGRSLPPRRWRTRTGLVVAETILLGAWLIPQIAGMSRLPFGALGAGMLACAIGAVLAGVPRGSLWENNQPPSPEVAASVVGRHREPDLARRRSGGLKRVFDLALSSAGLVVSLPLSLSAAILLWWEDPGPVLFVKNSVGLHGRNFKQFKFRTMIQGAEEKTGPIWASARDPRVLWLGAFLRKTALDELPQLFNILIGDMSFVGPRPQRTVLVAEYLDRMPEYAERHSVRPGLAGLAQVAGSYYITPRQKLRLDMVYVRHASLGFDIRLLAVAFLVVFWHRWQRAPARIPRSWLHPPRPSSR